MPFLRPKKSKKWPKLRPGGAHRSPGVRRWLGSVCPGPQGRRLFARESTLYQGTMVTKYKVQRYKVTRQVREGNKAILRDLTRPKAKGLANFIKFYQTLSTFIDFYQHLFMFSKFYHILLNFIKKDNCLSTFINVYQILGGSGHKKEIAICCGPHILTSWGFYAKRVSNSQSA